MSQNKETEMKLHNVVLQWSEGMNCISPLIHVVPVVESLAVATFADYIHYIKGRLVDNWMPLF
jgi:hypothetical protein